jgi:hypothetical protein
MSAPFVSAKGQDFKICRPEHLATAFRLGRSTGCRHEAL